MLKNYLKTAFRNLSRNKVYASLNIIGLSLGIGCALVIFKVITYETSFDKHHSNFDRIYRVVTEDTRPNQVDKGMGTPHPLGTALRSDYSELVEVCRTVYYGSAQINIGRGVDLKKFMVEEKIGFVDPSFLKIFDVEFLYGDKITALTQPNTAVISSELAITLFGVNDDEVDQVIGKSLGFGPFRDFEIVGIIEQPNPATNFPFSLMLNYESQDHPEISPYFDEGKEWNSISSSTNTYFLANDNFNPSLFNEQLEELVKKYYDGQSAETRDFIVKPL